MRDLYMILSPRSLPYARVALQSLCQNAIDAFHLRLITDSPADKTELTAAMSVIDNPHAHRWEILDEQDLSAREEAMFGTYPHIQAFRHGHPCWRKITDPLLLSQPGEEMVVLDPDVWFPNRFNFEPTPANGILLMWQQPNCLLPPETVHAAMSQQILLANHVDIGVAHWRAPVDLDWLNWLLGGLGGAALPRMMHVEAIVWSALIMRFGGAHLNPTAWRCWRYSQTKRVMCKLGASGTRILAPEPWSQMKCFHAGGEAKWWLADATERAASQPPREHSQPTETVAVEELEPSQYARELARKAWVRKLGYYRFVR